MEKILGGLYAGSEYLQAMKEAQEEYDAWALGKRSNHKANKEKYRAQRLAKLDAMKMLGR